jgi:UDP-N-acetyl-D-mannosaminuronic acid dehydrogenase
MKIDTVSIYGLGYIGLPTAAVLASNKVNVIGVDVNASVVDTINSGNIHIEEPFLEDLVQQVVNDGFLKASIQPQVADAFLIAVPTPFFENSADEIPKPNLSYIESACKTISSVIKSGDVVIIESTSPVGTTEKVQEWLMQLRQDLTFPKTHGGKSDIRIAYCPERVLPGQVIHELVSNDRLIGGITEECSKAATAVYKKFVKGNCVHTNSKTAEMAKLTENAYRDVNIAFANELSIISEKLNINVWDLIKLSNLHPRVNILNPGPGVGGHCIAVDPWFIVSRNPEEANLIKMARIVNDSKPLTIIEKVENIVNKKPDVKLSIFGLAYKPDIDDLRESPALFITREISRIRSGNLMIVEPNINELPLDLKDNNKLVDSKTALDQTDYAIILVPHSIFIETFNKIKLTNNILDYCGILET